MLDLVLEKRKLKSEIRTPSGVIGRKIAENQYFYLNLTGRRQIIERETDGYAVLKEQKVGKRLVLDAYDGELIAE